MASTSTANTLSLEVFAIDRLPYKMEVKQVKLPGVEGLFIVLPGHAPLVSSLEIGVINALTANDEHRVFATVGGVVRVLDNKVSVLSRTAEIDEHIDRDRAEASKTRALERLNGDREKIDVLRAEASLHRALARLQVLDQVRS